MEHDNDKGGKKFLPSRRAARRSRSQSDAVHRGSQANPVSEANSTSEANSEREEEPVSQASPFPAGRRSRRKKQTKARRRRMLGTTVASVLVFAAIYVGVNLYNLQPTHHFRAAKLPVVASPQGDNSINGTNNITAAKQIVGQDGTFNVLFLGIDSRAPSDPGHTDTIIVVHVNLVTHQYNAISIPRDTRVDLPPYGETKITHAQYMGTLNGGLSVGIKDIVQAASNFTGLKINYYAETSFWGLESLVDAVGGVNVYLPTQVNLQTFKVPSLPAGEHLLNGLQVHELVGERDSLPNGDFGRQKFQEDVLVALGHKILSPANVGNLPKVLGALKKYLVATNLSTADAVAIALNMTDFSSSQVHYYQVPGHSAVMMDPIVGTNLDYWIADMPEVRKIIQAHFG